ncbi:hypothetical protein [Amycolatopsis keratiniphila]|uniref:YxiG-like domain-containing protein n=1 Tax=Amycolatopsis keratiniphila TaxID=129921 RepID=R4T2Q2_9PSEU|nr:hypothetical protein AORI_4126 [Amycolatopsis keratiniphila]
MDSLYPGAKLRPGTADTDAWSARLGRPFHEAMIEADGHTSSLVFSDLSVDRRRDRLLALHRGR